MSRNDKNDPEGLDEVTLRIPFQDPDDLPPGDLPSQDSDPKPEEEVEVPSAEIIHLALIRERFERTQAVEAHEADTCVVYVELMRGLETWAANTLCLDMERLRRQDTSEGWEELRDPVTEFEKGKILEVLREMHDALGRQWGLIE